MKRLLFSFLVCAVSIARPTLVVGSKSFTESYILAEIAAQVAESVGEVDVERRFGLGQTGIAFEAMRNGKVDIYPEYTGTIAQAILKNPAISGHAELKTSLAPMRMLLGDALGFSNTYALALKEATARKFNLSKLSELVRHPEFRAGLTHEFMEREDGYPRLAKVYGLKFPKLHGIAHSLAYEAIDSGDVDIIDIYSTDSKIVKFRLKVLEDDKHAFPEYQGVFLARDDLPERMPKTWEALQKLRGRFTESDMIRLNGEVELEHRSFAEVAREFLNLNPRAVVKSEWLKLTAQHLYLVFLSLFASLMIGLPLGALGRYFPRLGQAILFFTGVVQTIPSLALLCFLIPLFGIGNFPALVALFLYGLLPIVRSSYLGFQQIDPKLREVARALGLSRAQRLLRIDLPLATPAILSGAKISAVINVGNATLAALIGAGGYGVPIVAGLALNDMSMVLRGAVPAAIMALFVHAGFEALDRLVVSKGLR